MPLVAPSRRLVQNWDDLDSWLDRYVAGQYIPTLIQFAQFIQATARINVDARRGERKDVILAKIREGFRTMMRQGNFSAYQSVRVQCEAAGRDVPSWSPGYSQAPPPTFGGVPAPSASTSLSTSGAASLSTGPSRYNASSQYRPQAASSSSGWNTSTSPVHTLLDWKVNPMFKAVKALTGAEMLPDIGVAESSQVNRKKHITFYLPQDVVTKLQQTKSNPTSVPHYALRVFCTSSDFYRPPGMALYPGSISASNRHIPIEYPGNPEFAFEGVPLAFRERGLRGKPGSAPPFDLGKANITLVTSRLNTLTMGHTGPTIGKKKEHSKRFYFQVVLAEIITKDELLTSLLAKKPTTIEEALAAVRNKADDDDIVAESSRMTLKDPLSYMRITQPIRSTECTHIQCFDAKWWIEGNAQHPQFLCPLCNKALRFDDLIVDGYFMSILNAVPESVDEVVVDADYEWSTEDGKYSSVNKRAASVAPPPTPMEPKPEIPEVGLPSPSDTPHGSPSSPKTDGKRKAIEILSSDDEDEQPLSLKPPPVPSASFQNRPLPLRTPSASASVPPSGPGHVIDLTLSDSDDETDVAPSPPHFQQPGATVMTSNSRSAPDPSSYHPVRRPSAGDGGVRLNGHTAQSSTRSPSQSDSRRLPDIDTSSRPMGFNRYSDSSRHNAWSPFASSSRNGRYEDEYRQSDMDIYEPPRQDHYSPPRYNQESRHRYSPPRSYRSNNDHNRDYARAPDAPQRRYRASDWVRDDLARGYGSGNNNSRT